MFKRIMAITFTMAIVTSSIEVASAASPTPEPVTFDNSAVANVSIPRNLAWGAPQLKAAASAEKYLSTDIQSELNALKAKGAVIIHRTWVKTRPPFIRNWHDFVPSFRQWFLEGTNAKGKVVGKSVLLPKDTTELASRLVTFGPNGCSLANGARFPCKISAASPSDYLYASLRTWFEMNGAPGSGGEAAGYVLWQVQDCFNEGYKYTVSSKYFDCPALIDLFSQYSPIPLVFYDNISAWGYTLTVDKATNTAIFKLAPPNLNAYAHKGFWVKDTAVVNFSR